MSMPQKALDQCPNPLDCSILDYVQYRILSMPLPPAGTSLAEWTLIFELEYFKQRELLKALESSKVKVSWSAPPGAVNLTATAVAEHECFMRLSLENKKNYVVGSLPLPSIDKEKK